MSDRGTQLLKTADEQIGGLIELLSTADEAVLGIPVPGRDKLGDGTVAALASHTAENYLRIAGFLAGDEHSVRRHPGMPRGAHRIPSFLRRRGHRSGGHGPSGHSAPYIAKGVSRDAVIERLSAGREALNVIGGLSDTQLDTVPPASEMKFCDGQRTLEQVVTSMFKHQSHQVDALRAAVTVND